MTQPRLLDTETLKVIREQIAAEDETPENRYLLEEYFAQRPCINGDMASATEATRMVANRHFEVLGTHASSDDVTFDATNAGILLTTDGASADQCIVCPHLDTNQTAWANIKWGTENQVDWTGCIKTGAAITTVQIWAGLKLTNTPVIATDADQVFFRYNTTDDTTAYWTVISSIGGTDTKTVTPVAIAVDSTYKFRIKINADRTASCYINDVLVYTTAALTNDVDLIPYIGVHALDTAATTLIINYEKISRVLFE